MNYVKTKDQRPPIKQTFNARANQGGEKARVSYFISYHKYYKTLCRYYLMFRKKEKASWFNCKEQVKFQVFP